MDCSQDLLEFDSEVNRINIPRESDSFLPVLPSMDIPEESWEGRLNTPPVTPLQFPHAFVKEERWLFSPPPIMPVIPTHSEVKSSSNVLDTTKIGLNSTPHASVREKKSTVLRKRAARPTSLTLPSEEHPPRKRTISNTVTAHLNCSIQGMLKPSTSIGNEHFGKTSVHPIPLVRPVTLPVGLEPTIWHLPSLLQIISHPTHHLTNAIHEPSSLPDTQEVVGILLSKLFRIVMFT